MNAMKKLLGWVDDRFPLIETWKYHLSEYYAPKNFNFWYFFGGLALLVLVIQIVSGIFLTMNYKPDAVFAFASVEYIMRDVQWGWLLWQWWHWQSLLPWKHKMKIISITTGFCCNGDILLWK